MNNPPIANFLVKNRYVLLIASILFWLACAAGLQHVTFESDYKQFFRADDPQRLAHESNENTYTKSDSVVFSFGTKDKNSDLFNTRHLSLIEDITAELWKFPHAIRVDSISNYNHSEASGFDLKVYPLFKDAADMSAEEIAKRKKIALSEIVLVNRLISDDATTTNIAVNILMPETTAERDIATKTMMVAAREIRTRIRQDYPELETHIIGVPVVDTAFNESTAQDMENLVPIMFVVILLLTGILLRSFMGTVAVLVLIMFTVPATIGTVGWLGIPLNQVSVSAPLIIMTLCVCDAIHIFATHLQSQREGLDQSTARVKSLDINMQPVFLTSITTAIGFLSLNFSDSPPFREWGTIVAVGVMYAWLFSLGVLPALMGIVKAKVAPNGENNVYLDKLANWVLGKQRILLWGGLGLAAAIIACVPRNELTDSTYQYFDHGVPLRDAAEFMENRINGFDNIAFSLSSGGPDSVTEPEYLKKLEAFADWAWKQDHVIHVNSFSDVMKRLNKNLNEDDPDYYRIPQEKPLAVEALMLYEMSLPFGTDLNNQVSFDKSATRFNVSLRHVKAKQIIEFEQKADAWLAANAPEMHSPGSSVSVMFAHIGQNNIRSMLVGSIIALIGISITLFLALRSWRVGLLSLIPNTLPAMIAFGIWGIFVAEVNLAAAAVFSITLGIVVDDTVHFLSKYLRARRIDGKNSEEAVRYAYRTVGAALLVTTVAVGLGFMVLTLSDFAVNELTGLLTAITISIALIYDMLVLPPLLIKLDKWLKLD